MAQSTRIPCLSSTHARSSLSAQTRASSSLRPHSKTPNEPRILTREQSLSRPIARLGQAKRAAARAGRARGLVRRGRGRGRREADAATRRATRPGGAGVPGPRPGARRPRSARSGGVLARGLSRGHTRVLRLRTYRSASRALEARLRAELDRAAADAAAARVAQRETNPPPSMLLSCRQSGSKRASAKNLRPATRSSR